MKNIKCLTSSYKLSFRTNIRAWPQKYEQTFFLSDIQEFYQICTTWPVPFILIWLVKTPFHVPAGLIVYNNNFSYTKYIFTRGNRE